MFSKIDVVVSVTGLIAGACFTACGLILCKAIADYDKLDKERRAINILVVTKAMGDAADKLPEKKTEK